MRSFVWLLALVVLTGQSVAASARNSYCIAGDLAAMTVPEKNACIAQLNSVRNSVEKYPHPDDWHFVVVCGEQSWRDFLVLSGLSEGTNVRMSAHTDLTSHATFINASALPRPNSTSPDGVVVHELARIHLNTNNPATIDAQVARWERALKPSSPVYLALR